MGNTDGKIKVILADDHPIVRLGIAMTLKSDPELEVIAEFGNGKKVIEFLKTTAADIVILDVEMPVMNGLETLNIINLRFREVKVIMLTMHSDESLIHEIINAGASGYLSKSCNDTALISYIKKVQAQGSYFEQHILQKMLSRTVKNNGGKFLFTEFALSEKETEVLIGLCNEKTMREIAESHHITIDTVRFHLRNLYSKTKTRKTAGLIKYAIRNSIIQLD
jgi:two-component system response regulator DegU